MENNAPFNIYGINIELNNMFEIIKQNIYISFNALLEHVSVIDAVNNNELQVNRINKGITRNLQLLMASDPNMQEARQAAALFSINIDLERISDHTVNIAEAEESLIRMDAPLSLQAYDELSELLDTIMQSLRAIDDMATEDREKLLELIRENEDRIDEICQRNREAEIERMKNRTDEPNSGIVYSELLIDIERIGDHLINVAESFAENY